MKKRRTIFNEENFFLFIVIVSLGFHQTKGWTATLEREVGSGNDWAIGYQGHFYIATVDTTYPVSIRWDFTSDSDEQRYDPSLGTCLSIRNATSFTSSCESLNGGGMRSVLSLNRQLDETDDGGSVEFYAEVSTSDFHRNTTTFNVEECSTTSLLQVSSNDNKYGTIGVFNCPYNNTIYYKDSSTVYVDDVRTSCQADATWKYENRIQCGSDRLSIPEFDLLNLNKLIIENNDGILMRSDQKMLINCDVESNPPAECKWILKPSKVLSSECNTTINLEKSGMLECQATNIQYTEITPTKKDVLVTMVNEKREPTIYDLVYPDVPKEIIDVKENGSLFVGCKVDYEDELNTTFNWIFPDGTNSHNKTLELNTIKPSDDGDYCCFTKDDFGENSKPFSLNVQFPPRKLISSTNKIVFTWIENSKGECQIEYYSNPIAEHIYLTKNGTVVEWSVINIQITQDKKQVLTIQKNKVTQSDKGMYELQISSYLFPGDSMSIEFQIIVEPPSTDPNKAVIISCSCVGVILLISIGLFVFYRIRTKKKKEANRTNSAPTDDAHKEVDSNINPYSTFQPSRDGTVKQKDEDDGQEYVNMMPLPMSSNQGVYIN